MASSIDNSQNLELKIGGMSCAACAAHIEKALNNMPGVNASVNYATEKATISQSGDFGAKDFIKTVEKTGYSAFTDGDLGNEDGQEHPKTSSQELTGLRRRLIICALLAVPVAFAVPLLAMGVPASDDSGGAVGSLPVPPRGLRKCSPRHHHYGYPDFFGYFSCFYLVFIRPLLRRCWPGGNDP